MNENHVYIIAEAGVNHNGSIEIAKNLIKEAGNAGVDAIKFQTFKTENLISKTAPKAEYQVKNTGNVESQFEMLKKLELPENSYLELINLCNSYNMDFLSTPFDKESLDFLVCKCNIKTIKIASGEITNAPLLLEAAHTNKPVILSTGMCTLGEIEEALSVLAFGYLYSHQPEDIEEFREAFFSEAGQKILKNKVILLHCTTEYPAPIDEINLRCINTLEKAFGLPVGYSDHTNGSAISLAAVALGASIIEKHFTLSRELVGPDHKASLEPEELKKLVKDIRNIEKSLGNGKKIPTVSEKKNLKIARKSLIAASAVKKGEIWSPEKLTTKRPGDGLAPIYYWNILNKTVNSDYEKDEKVHS